MTQTKMKFSKMHGLSNDFMIIDGIHQNIKLSPKIIKKLSNRNCGVGFDQLLIVKTSNQPKIDFKYKIFNANGNEVSQCGNGARCFAIFVYKKKITNKKNIYITTNNNRMILNILNKNLVRVNMGVPNFNYNDIPFKKNNHQQNHKKNILNINVSYDVVSIGNPHCVLIVKNLNNIKIEKIGKILEKHQNFPEGVNTNFMKILNKKHIKLRVYERDVGETKSCGSGACAAVAIGIKKQLLSNTVKVKLLGGELLISWKGGNNPIYMTGPATHVYDGIINIKNFY